MAGLCLSQRVVPVPRGGLWSGTGVNRGLFQNSAWGLEAQGTMRGLGARGQL